jgi:competence protein ComEC
MFGNSKKNTLIILFLALLVFDFVLLKMDYENSHRKLTFAMLDVGQGDALFIESPTGVQILIDAGSGKKVISQLSKVMPLFDRSLDAVFITHPDQDHIGGFTDVLKNYSVGAVFESGVSGSSKTFQNLKTEIENKKIPDILARRGTRLDIGGGAFIDILFPDRDVSTWETNEGSIVAKLSYGNNSIMLTGDAPIKTEKIILSENSDEVLHSEFLKVGHHGSRTSTSLDFLKAISPKYSLISVGLDNKYGHPHKEVLDFFNNLGIKIFRTDESGLIKIKMDGKTEKFSFLK